jgi:lysylphosphatidylglycerol synthetase-like protein (DUF2156 family)
MLANGENIEHAAGQIGPIMLLILGLATVLAGLFFWLGGLRFKKILLPATGLIAGGAIGLFAFSKGIAVILISIAFCVILGIILEIMSERILSRKAVFGRVMIALLFSAAGTAIIFSGMIGLLIYKGADPLGEVSGRSGFYAAVFAGMTIFGTIVQSVLCRKTQRGMENMQKEE